MFLFISRYPWTGIMAFVVLSILSSQTPAGQGGGRLTASARGFFLLKGSFIISTVASCILRMGDWIEVKFGCNLLVSLARLISLNWTYLEFN